MSQLGQSRGLADVCEMSGVALIADTNFVEAKAPRDTPHFFRGA
jgi:hypothetical protein